MTISLPNLRLKEFNTPITVKKKINVKKKAAYPQLADLLYLSGDAAEKIEWAADQELKQQDRAAQAGRSNFREVLGRLR